MKNMTDDNTPTELEQFEMFSGLAAKLNIPYPFPEGLETFMKKGIEEGKSVASCLDEWKEKNPEEEVVEEKTELSTYTTFLKTCMEGDKTLAQCTALWADKQKETESESPWAKSMTSRLEALEASKLAERKIVLSGLVAEVKKIDKTFDEKRFIVALESDSSVERGIGALTIYLEAIKHYRGAIPELRSKMALASPNEAKERYDKASQDLFGVDYDPDKIVEMI